MSEFQDRQAAVEKVKITYGPELGASAKGDEDEEDEPTVSGLRMVKSGSRVSSRNPFWRLITPPSLDSPFIQQKKSGLSAPWILNQVDGVFIFSFRFLNLYLGIKLLGFKPRSELAFEDNVKHSMFIYPDEIV